MDRRTLLNGLCSTFIANFLPCNIAVANNHQLQGYLRTNWSQDPYSYGSYSYIAKGARRRHIRALEKPVADKIFFAGEATYPDYNSTVHAAYESGQRVANTILESNAQSIAIVGAGMSGLSAAHKLSNAGLKVTVLEARDRIGGRIWTDRHLGLPLDLGASWIHGINGNPITQLADSINQKRQETGDRYILRGRNGRIMKDADAPPWLEDVISTQHTAGTEPDRINNWAYLFQDDYGGVDVTFPNGYAQIFDSLKGNYEVRKSTFVEHITIQGDDVTINTIPANQQKFDAVLVTVPLGTLKKQTITFAPALPPQKIDAIQRLGMGTLDKVYLLFNETFWDQEADWIITPENDLPIGHFNQWLNLYKYLGKPIIMAFNGGSAALDIATLSDEEVIANVLQTLAMAYPEHLSP